VLAQRRVLPLAIAFALAGVLVLDGGWARAAAAVLAATGVALLVWERRRAPAVRVDADGYAVVERGRDKLRVAWSEVVRVRVDAAEHALYVDCGDPARNLLVPPRHGWGFHFEGAEELFRLVCAAVPDRVEAVARLDAPPPPSPSTSPSGDRK
jgi:hypothetical protein